MRQGSCDDDVDGYSYCDRTLFLLLRTFLEIIALRKGPDQVPSSSLLLLVSVALMLLASVCGITLIPELGRRDLALGLAGSTLVIVVYAGVLVVTGFARRMVRALTCVIGCGALLTMLSVAEFVLFRPFVGQNLAGSLALLISFWSIPVEGHIVSRTIGQHWFTGIAIAVAATVLQFIFQSILTGQGTGTD